MNSQNTNKASSAKMEEDMHNHKSDVQNASDEAFSHQESSLNENHNSCGCGCSGK